MSKVKRFLGLFWLLAFWVSNTAIAQDNLVIIGTYEDAPLIFKDTDNELKGVYKDLLEHIALKYKWKLEYVHGSFSENQSKLQKGQIDILCAIGHSEEREKRFDFSEATVYTNWGEIYVPKGSKIRSILDLKEKTVAVLAGDFYYESSHGLKHTSNQFKLPIKFIECGSYDEVLEKVQKKEADAGLVAVLHGAANEKKYNVQGSPIVFHPIELRFAFTKGTEKTKRIKKIVDDEMDRMINNRNSVYHQSVARWLGKEAGGQYLVYLKWGLIIAAGVALFFVAITLFLRRQVNKRTEQLYNKTLEVQELNENLEHKVKERTAEVSRQRDELEEQKVTLERMNKEMRDSINYARNIQEAMLPEENNMSLFLRNNYFKVFMPRDVVSGDFHWLAYKDDRVLLAVADCTGHGVPGAFMSMLGKSSLDAIVNEKNIYQPGSILTELQNSIYHSLGTNAADGMDVALCSFDFKNRKVTFAGAQRPFYFVRGGEVNVVKGDKKPIGGSVKHYKEKREYKDHEIDMLPGDMFYMTSDGYPDQFGGPEGRKFTTRRFKTMISEIYNLPTPEQGEKVSKAFLDWKGEERQIDDILVIGVKMEVE